MRPVLLYAPMNPPGEGALPSGDRAMLGLLAKALETLGFQAKTASSLRAYEAQGDTVAQAHIAQQGAAEAERLIALHRASPPAFWLTYMNYYRSPDHIGPKVAEALNIPYVIVEASYAAKREAGAFAAPHAAAKRALQAADAVFAMTPHDRVGLAQIVPPERLHDLAPFIDLDRFPKPRPRPARTSPVILTTAMLRPGKKMANFPLIAEALARIADLKWLYMVAGDGEGRAEAEAAFAKFPRDRVLFAGRFPPEAMPQIYARADLYLWPGLREAYGLSYLEAQASGLPVVACDTHGVPAVVARGAGGLLTPAGDPDGLAQSLRILLSNHQTREIMSEVAREFIEADRTIPHAAARIGAVLRSIMP